MKRNYYTVIAMAMVMAMAFTGCERDYYYYDEPWGGDYFVDPYTPDNSHDDGYLISMASVLRGQWQGTITTDFYDAEGNHKRQTYNTDFQFDQYTSNTINGRGRETDFTEDGKEVYRTSFTWYIDERTEDIYLKFDDERVMVVTSFHLDDDSFYGTMQSSDGQETDEFNLKRYTFSNRGLTFDVE